MARIGYARISTVDQSLDLQIEALKASGCAKIFTDVASGARDDRPGLSDALEYMRAKDVLVTWKLDRVGRSTAHLVALINDLRRREIGFASLTEAMDTTTPAGELLFTVVAALAQFERSLIVERTRAGLEAARARGSKPGRKPSLSADQVQVVRQMNSSGQHTVAAIAGVVGVSRATVYRTLAAQPSCTSGETR
jgi:DNA invertase Pin-like site-specific DNA recombinase